MLMCHIIRVKQPVKMWFCYCYLIFVATFLLFITVFNKASISVIKKQNFCKILILVLFKKSIIFENILDRRTKAVGSISCCSHYVIFLLLFSLVWPHFLSETKTKTEKIFLDLLVLQMWSGALTCTSV